MRLRIAAVGTRLPAWVYQALEDYEKRIVSPVDFDIKEVAAEKRGKNADIERIKNAEGERLLEAVPGGATIIALDERGRSIDTMAFSRWLQESIDNAQDLCFLIGGADGLSATVKQRASRLLRLSDFTLAHPVARVVMAEQVYRAYSIIRNLPYHRA